MSDRRSKAPDLLRHAAPWLDRFPLDEPCLIGVSGGRDSIALLHALLDRGFSRLIVCHLDHKLRPESAGDARFVGRLARKWKLERESGSENVGAQAKRDKRSIETAARVARYDFFAKVAQKRGCARLFLAHHADDQVETFLFHLFRGAGTTGLGGMRALHVDQNGIEIARPLLDVWREEIDAYIVAHDLEFREDDSNADLQFTRNRLRLDIIPSISSAFGRDVRKAIWRAAEILRREDEFLSALPAGDEAAAELRVADLREYPVAIQRRIVLHWLRAHGIPHAGFTEVEAVRDLLGMARAKVNLPGGWFARRNRGRVFLQSPDGQELSAWPAATPPP
jgi:tRNA(Ile)-lysidine synthase